MQASPKIWFVLAGITWISAATMLTLGFLQDSLRVLRWVSMGDAALAVVFTVIALQKLNR